MSIDLFSQVKKKPKEEEFDIKNYKLEPADRLIIEINHTSWIGFPPAIKIKTPSIGVNIALMFDKPIRKTNFSFGYGMGLFSHNFHSNADFIYVKDSASNSFTTKLEPYSRPVSINRYAEKILEIPVELRFRTKTDRQFKIHLGGKIGYVVSDFRSIKDNDGKIRVYNIKNINPLRYGINFRIGFEQIAICATYYLSEVFSKNRGPGDIHPFAIGLAIIPY
ncbi:MAG: outer membrane beta-barrel protein [Bacteroidia bacterium]